MDSVIGVLDLQTTAQKADGGDIEQIELLIQQRNAARAAKDWAAADGIRDQLLELGIAIKDEGGTTVWERVVQ